MNNQHPPFVVVRSSTHVEIEWIKLPEVEIQFDSIAEEHAYVNQDVELSQMVLAAVMALANASNPEQVVYISSD